VGGTDRGCAGSLELGVWGMEGGSATGRRLEHLISHIPLANYISRLAYSPDL
jgi:hypothetical protein